MSPAKRPRPAAVALSRALALGVTGALFLIGGPVVSASAFGALHDFVHVLTFALLTSLYAFAWPQLHWLRVALGALALAATHELYQLTLHQQQFETGDFALNCLGTACATAMRALFTLRRRGV